MNKHYLLVGIIYLICWLPAQTLACGFNFVTTCSTTLDISADGTPTTFFAGPCTYLTPIHNHDFGAVNTLQIDMGKMITWESCDNRVLNGTLYYRAYTLGSSPVAFSAYTLDQLNSSTVGNYTTRTQTSNIPIDLLAGLPSGNFELELYFEGDVDTNLDNIPDALVTMNNGGSNYKALFTVINGTGGAIAINYSNQNDVTCFGGNDGSVTAQGADGTAPYAYNWSNGGATATITNLSATTYFITVTDALGATGTSSLLITQPSAIAVNATATNESSPNANDGTATANPSGGTSPYTFAWSNNGTTATITGLDSGAYTCTVTDANNCTSSETVFVSIGGTAPGNYCTSQSSSPWVDWISNVTFNTLNHDSNKSNYSDFTSESTIVSASSSYTIELKTTFSWATYDEYWRVWIDYNRDGVFQEPAEIAYSGILTAPPTGTTTGIVSGTVNIPASVDLGLTRMRVSMTRSNYPGPCETLAFGEVEDYAVWLDSGGSPTCNITATVSNIICDDNGTNSNPADDTFTFNVNVTGNGTSSSWSTTINGSPISGTYGTSQNLGPYDISNGAINFTIEDSGDPLCIDPVTVNPPATCSGVTPCSIASSVTNILCDDNGTNSNPADDTFTFDLTVTGTGTGAGWTTSINGNVVAGNYNVSQNLGPFSIANGALNFTIVDAAEPTCTNAETVNPPATCSGVIPCSIASSITNILCDDNGTNSNPADDTFTFDLTVTGTGTGAGWTTSINGNVIAGNYNVSQNIGPFSIANGAINFTIVDNAEPTCTTAETVNPPATCSGVIPCSITSSVTNILCDDNGTDSDPSDDTFTFDLTVTGTGTGAGWTTSINGNVIPGNYNVSQNLGPFNIANGTINFTIVDIAEPTCTVVETVNPPSTCSGVTPCSIASSVTNILCDDNGTNSNPADDTFTFDLTVTGTGTGAGWTASINGNVIAGNYNVSQNIGPFNISNGALNFTIVDDAEPTCTTAETVNLPATCSGVIPCSISSSVTNILCDDNGTNSNPSDDTFTFDLTVTGTGTGAGWTASINGNLHSGNYSVVENIGPFPTNGGNLNFTIEDDLQATCTTSQVVTTPSPCSNGSTGTYCPSVSTFPWHDWIAGVELTNINNPSGKSTYSDFTNLATNLVKDQSEIITLTAGYSWFTYEEYWRVWIDYNQDGTFQEPDEIAFSVIHAKPPNGTNSDPVSGSITVPASALDGNTRMRVSMKREAFPSPCEFLPFGEVEDYTVNISASAAAPEQEDRSLSNLSLKAQLAVNNIELFWLAPNELAIDQMIIEKWIPKDELFESIFESAAIDNQAYQFYETVDQEPLEGENIYRLKILYADGREEVSLETLVWFSPVLDYILFPNPAVNSLNVQMETFLGKAVQINIVNSMGHNVYQHFTESLESPILEIAVHDWKESIYFVHIKVEGKKAVGKKLVVLRN